MAYVGSFGADRLQKYKYSGLDLSLTSKFFFQPFWSRFVLLFPLYIAPNLITLMGLGFITLSTSLSYVYCPDLLTPSPRWLYLVHGLFLFLYQTFDAVDGKQARRTGSSSPLGELFDHGCDAVAVTLEALTFGSVALLGGKGTLFAWFVASSTFYFSTWETYHTHTLLLQPFNGPTEGLLLMYTAEIATAFVGADWWAMDFRAAVGLPQLWPFIPGMSPAQLRPSLHLLLLFVSWLAELPVKLFVLWAFLIPAVLPTLLTCVHNVRGALRKGGRGSLVEASTLLLPYWALLGMHVAWVWVSPANIMATHPYLMMTATGLTFALLVGRLILAHLTEKKGGLLGAMVMPLFLPPLAILNGLWGMQGDRRPYVDERWILVAHVAYTGFLYAHFCHGVIRDICRTRNIYCLRLGKRRENLVEIKNT